MEHFIVITLIICIASSIFFTPCDSLLGTVAGSDYDHHLTHSVLPRKLRPGKDDERKNLATHGAKQDAFLAGKAHKNEAKKMQSSIKTWREYFSMDYSPVRRRRPIHNKSHPVAP